jgi:hypothetical protein
MFDSMIESPVVLTLLCGFAAALVVSPGYVSLNRLGHAIPALMPAKFQLRSFAKAVVIAFILLINAISLGAAHRLPLGSTLVAVGVLMLLFLPADESDAGA